MGPLDKKTGSAQFTQVIYLKMGKNEICINNEK